MVNARVLGRATVVETEEGKFLLIDIEIACPHCGKYVMRFAGHHLKPIRDLIVDFIAQYPELAGPDSQLDERREFDFPAREPRDPRNN